MQLLFLLFSSYFASLFCLYLNTRYADLKVPFDMMGHILEWLGKNVRGLQQPPLVRRGLNLK